MDFLRQVREKVARVFFIPNKIDYHSGSECDNALEFLKKSPCRSIGTIINPMKNDQNV